MSFAQKLQKGIAIVIPKLGQFCGRGEFATGQLEGDLHASVPDVVIVLHATSQWIPRSSVGCSISKLRSTNLMEIKNIRTAQDFPGFLFTLHGSPKYILAWLSE